MRGGCKMVLAAMLLALTGGAPAQPADRLVSGHWDPFNRSRLQSLIDDCGRRNPSYDARKPPYAIFDWDNTSVFLDMEEAVMVYQLQNLVYALTPAQLDQALRRQVPSSDFKAQYHNLDGQSVNIEKIVPDIIESYSWLFRNYRGLQGELSLEEVRKSPHYLNFISKMRYLYDALEDSFSAQVAFPWIILQFGGMTPEQLRQLTANTVEWQSHQPIGEVCWTSPASLPGRAGVVTVKWKNGLRLLPEMQDLYHRLREGGFDVWVCTASLVDIIREVSSNPKFGYNNRADQVIGLELERDESGTLKPEFRHGYEVTYGPGKTTAIRRFLVARYGYGPTLVGGDSGGDVDMMQDFADTRLVLIINLLRDPGSVMGKLSAQASQTYGNPRAKFLLQGRDDNTGQFVPSQLNVRWGKTKGQLLGP